MKINKELDILQAFEKMCEESLSPELNELFDRIALRLKLTRPALKPPQGVSVFLKNHGEGFVFTAPNGILYFDKNLNIQGDSHRNKPTGLEMVLRPTRTLPRKDYRIRYWKVK